MDAQFGGVDQRKIFTFAEKVCDDVVNYVQWLVVTLDNLRGFTYYVDVLSTSDHFLTQLF